MQRLEAVINMKLRNGMNGWSYVTYGGSEWWMGWVGEWSDCFMATRGSICIASPCLLHPRVIQQHHTCYLMVSYHVDMGVVNGFHCIALHCTGHGHWAGGHKAWTVTVTATVHASLLSMIILAQPFIPILTFMCHRRMSDMVM